MLKGAGQARIVVLITVAVCFSMGSHGELPEETSSLFSGSGNCAFCHEQWSGALLDAEGNNVSITADWRATMMAHSLSDPLWRARMAAEVHDRPELRGFIEDKCLTCHAPMARTQFRHDSGRPLSLEQALGMELARDGVSCTLCHQIQAGNLGEENSLDGGYVIGEERRIFGPYEDVVTGPMRNHVDYTPTYGRHVQESDLCATCHTLFTPVLDDEGHVVGQFPEQVPYLEWKSSTYPSENRHCQDCHMPRLDEPIQITARPPWIGTREPFWRHTFLGANTFMLQLLADPENGLSTLADSAAFDRQIRMTREFLQGQTARLKADAKHVDGELHLRVNVENLAGHKFPTGYPYRRAWLRVDVRGEDGRILFCSGDVDEEGRLKSQQLQNGYTPHYQEISRPEDVQVYQAIMGDVNGSPTTYLLRATRYLKDNRIPPKGFHPGAAHAEQLAIRGAAANDSDYADGKGCDATLYRIAIPEDQVSVKVRVDLLYQSLPPESVDALFKLDLPAVAAFSRMYTKAGKAPEVLQSKELTIDIQPDQ